MGSPFSGRDCGFDLETSSETLILSFIVDMGWLKMQYVLVYFKQPLPICSHADNPVTTMLTKGRPEITVSHPMSFQSCITPPIRPRITNEWPT